METASSLARFARRLRVASLASAAALGAITLIAVFAPPQWRLSHVSPGALSLAQAMPVALVSMGLLVAALVELSRMLRHVEQGEPFASRTTRRFRRFALFLLLAALAEVMLPLLLQLGLIVFAGRRRFMIDFDDGELIRLLLGAVLFLVARLFDEAARLQEDSRSIV